MLSNCDTEIDILQAIIDTLVVPPEGLNTQALSPAELCELVRKQAADLLPNALLETLSSIPGE